MQKRNDTRFGGIVCMAGLLVAIAGCGDDDTASERANDAGGSGGASSASDAGGNAGTPGSVDAGGSAGAPASADAGDQPSSSGAGGTGGGGVSSDAGDHGSAGDGDIDAGLDADAGDDHGGDQEGDADAPTWSADIYPMLVGSCGGCHANSDGGAPHPGPGETGGDAPGKFAVDDSHMAYLAVKPFAIPHDPDDSALYIKISQDEPSTGGQRMPPALRQLEDSTIQMVRDWIAAGAIEN